MNLPLPTSMVLPPGKALPLTLAPAPILSHPSVPVGDDGMPVGVALAYTSIPQLAADMLETCRVNRGIGLAAPQVGLPLQVAVIDLRLSSHKLPYTIEVGGRKVRNPESFMPLILINPVVHPEGGYTRAVEGCLSQPGITGWTRRQACCTVDYQAAPGGALLSLRASGILARCIQHEVDHLNGILFTDRK